MTTNRHDRNQRMKTFLVPRSISSLLFCVRRRASPGRFGRHLREFVATSKAARPASPRPSPRPTAQRPSKTSSGSFEFARPNRFRFAYAKPFEQVIVADGQKVWIFDADLNQVSSRKLTQALGTTPAALLAGGRPRLQADFDLPPCPTRTAWQWVQATPKAKDSVLQGGARGLQGRRSWPRWKSPTASASARCCSSTACSAECGARPPSFRLHPPKPGPT